MLIACCSCSTTQVYLAAGVHSNDYDSNKWQHPNTIGTVLVVQPVTEIISVYFEHLSSIPDHTDNSGMNIIGGSIRIK